MRRTAASVSAKVVPPKWNPSTAMGPRREASMGSQGRLGRHGMGCGGVAEVGGRGAQDGRSETKNVRHRRHGSSGAPALTRPLAVALLKGVLEGSRLGGGARHAGRSCGVAEQRSAALGLEPIGARGAQPAAGHVFAEGVAPTSRAADEKRLAIVPARSNAQQICRLGTGLWQSGSKVTAYASRRDQRCWALGGGSPPEGTAPQAFRFSRRMTS